MSHSQLQSKNGGTCTEWFPSNLLGATYSLEALRFPSCGVGIDTDLFHAGDGPKPEFLGSLQTRCPQKPRGQEELTTSAQVTPAHALPPGDTQPGEAVGAAGCPRRRHRPPHGSNSRWATSRTGTAPF